MVDRCAAASIVGQAGIASSPGAGRWCKFYGAALISIVACAAVLRVWVAYDELLLDEIWSLLAFANVARSPADILTFHHDNNHYLSTFWMYLVGGEQSSWLVYRLPSIAAGIGTVLLAAEIARRWGAMAALAAAILTGVSHMLLMYSAEARGYALAGFFALLSFLALDRYRATRSRGANLLFVVAGVLGILSHLTFIQFFSSALIWSIIVDSPNWGQGIRRLAPLYAVPAGFYALLWTLDIRYMVLGGGDAVSLQEVFVRTLALAVGNAVPTQIALIVSAVLAVAITIAALILMSREGSDLWIFFACVVLAVPVMMVTALRPPILYERYFYISIVFFLILCSYLFGRLYQFGQRARLSAILALAAFVASNARLDYDVVRLGRGHYRDALTYMAANTEGRDIDIADNSDSSRNELQSLFYGPLVSRERRFICRKFAPDMPLEPEWYAVAAGKTPETVIRSPDGRDVYELEQVFPCAGLGGVYQLAVYHNRSRQTTGPHPEERAPAAQP